uniref:23 kDa jasmonate-induced protein-like n=1 Tax=Mycena chlorophos TaxID=658473 RepID=A0ABQ0LRF8_MYCCL|nr:predicted protein [Mycena chlorophos]
MSIFGLEVNPAYCKAMAEFRDRPIESITEADLARVAKGLKTKYQDQAEKRQAELKADYGTGVCSLVRIYNATGKPLYLKEFVDWRGHIGKMPVEHAVPNGCWTVFIHTKTAGAAVGSAAAAIYRRDGTDQDFFLGWQNPWRRGNTQIFCETFPGGHWFNGVSKDKMLDLMDDHNGQSHSHGFNGYNVYASAGNDTTSYMEFVCEKQ